MAEGPHLVLGAVPASAERADTSLTSLSDERNDRLSLICTHRSGGQAVK